ncbi:50S ribosomal protein L22 [Candidatus Peribacteria bacterium RIFCSPHIGHO2_02_FULL_52_16]|nr:MAG: 50S ribosomal protein L22 [Candidatus Peribacteria bacterium RIFCSPHIGHO2_01_FULL_51_35]OGJ61461.1 MAG: 50S ribosomal protein L22 [Candidatus Peribacteria bacterium RIFCSPHIGHO2_02_FULL_52_16]
MKAYLSSVRIAPKKANLIAKMVRGMSVPVAVEALRRTNKKAARIVETLLRSAIANTSHNDKQDPQMLIIKTIVVNQAQAYHRGIPKARGQVRPIRKYLSHISLVLGFPEIEESGEKIQKNQRNQKKSSSIKNKKSSESSASSDSSASS